MHALLTTSSILNTLRLSRLSMFAKCDLHKLPERAIIIRTRLDPVEISVFAGARTVVIFFASSLWLNNRKDKADLRRRTHARFFIIILLIYIFIFFYRVRTEHLTDRLRRAIAANLFFRFFVFFEIKKRVITTRRPPNRAGCTTAFAIISNRVGQPTTRVYDRKDFERKTKI